ncbi:tripartite tricarboxylate transporter substrate binding protein [Pigmentiphaga soli]|uniref:Tripartite tricarboxylate transporter substrate binding protein n=1 Tax=Pigmentiphaga soli TaxID=1007095 RepID=A0ABP8GGR1_9BURK
MNTLRRALAALICAGLACFCLPASAQSGPIRLIVGSAPGGLTDLVARVVAKVMSDELHQPVVVENRDGAAGNLASEHVAKSAPDGSTLLVNYTSFSANTSLYKKLPFDPVKDFSPISLLVSNIPSVLIVRKDFPANSLDELLALIRAHPGKYSAGLGGLGSSLHMATAIFKVKAGADVVMVPYKGAGPALVDLLGGHIDMMFNATINVASHVKQGTIKVLGVTSTGPLKEYPGAVPISSSVKGFESSSWYGLFGPANMPPAVVERLNKAARAAVASPEFTRLMESQAGVAQSSTPEELEAFLRKDIRKYAEVVKETGITLD